MKLSPKIKMEFVLYDFRIKNEASCCVTDELDQNIKMNCFITLVIFC